MLINMELVTVKLTVFLVMLTMSPRAVAAQTGTKESTCRPVRGLDFNQTSVPQDLIQALPVCTNMGHNTCCSRSNILPILRQVRKANVADFSAKCTLELEKLLCYPCDPNVGVGKITSVCRSMCDRVFGYCQDEFFEVGMTSDPIPCVGDSLVCSTAQDFAKDGTEFCQMMNFEVSDNKCYSGAVSNQRGEREQFQSMDDQSSIWVQVLKVFQKFQNSAGTAVIGFLVFGIVLVLQSR